MSAAVRSQSRRYNALQRHHGTYADITLEAGRDLRFVRLEDQIRAAVDQAPPLTDEQLATLRQLLAP